MQEDFVTQMMNDFYEATGQAMPAAMIHAIGMMELEMCYYRNQAEAGYVPILL